MKPKMDYLIYMLPKLTQNDNSRSRVLIQGYLPVRTAEHGEIMDLCTTFPVELKY